MVINRLNNIYSVVVLFCFFTLEYSATTGFHGVFFLLFPSVKPESDDGGI